MASIARFAMSGRLPRRRIDRQASRNAGPTSGSFARSSTSATLASVTSGGIVEGSAVHMR